MAIFIEETSDVWEDENAGEIGPIAPPATPVEEYYLEVFGRGEPEGMEEDGEMGDIVVGVRGIVQNQEIGGYRGGEREASRGKNAAGKEKDGRVSKTPRAARVFRKCAKCGTMNHNRRLFCVGCYGGKDEMKGKKKK